ncbi:alpha/beta hydrolase [Vitiosangium sp. GDMCC 1.1324]|uniref:alpha/beta hydrolase n=1 Tax=Vitiosangium sp. (strain GDMCC 1.1324) TaxID=2138576 RepID=UPI0018EEA51E|nr:phospholipase [Vitiosangium sp. GDMCC 1.1324]
MARAGVQAQTLCDETKEGWLRARPYRPRMEAPERGLWPLGFGGSRDGLLYVPREYRADCPAPLAVMLHGAGDNARHALSPWRTLADEVGLILLAPDSRGASWDLILEDGYGPDVSFIDQSLAYVFERYAVDPGRIALEGFSDGASYALSLGLTNGVLFTHVVAFSPGFLTLASRSGEPKVFLSHGVEDEVLHIEPCSRSILPLVEEAGYAVHYREFDGPHTIPPEIAREALAWFTTR